MTCFQWWARRAWQRAWPAGQSPPPCSWPAPRTWLSRIEPGTGKNRCQGGRKLGSSLLEHDRREDRTWTRNTGVNGHQIRFVSPQNWAQLMGQGHELSARRFCHQTVPLGLLNGSTLLQMDFNFFANSLRYSHLKMYTPVLHDRMERRAIFVYFWFPQNLIVLNYLLG